jgi:DNA-directed RNA polymerase specialized sigma24 family protein
LEHSSRALNEGLIAYQSSPSKEGVRRAQAVLLLDVLHDLPNDYREVTILRRLRGLGFPDVARQGGLTGDSFKNGSLRAMPRSRSSLEDLR